MTPITTWEEYKAAQPPCSVCEAPFDMLCANQEEMQSYIDAYNDLAANQPKQLEHFLEIQYRCPKCMWASEDQLEKARHRRHCQHVSIQCYGKGWMPKDAKEHTFANSDRDREEENATPWNMLGTWKGDTNLWLVGPANTGKTYAAHCLANRQMSEHGWTCAEITAGYLSDVSQRFKWTDILAPFCAVDLLVLEDFDKVAWMAKHYEALFHVIDSVWRAKKRLVVTSNHTPQFCFKNLKTWDRDGKYEPLIRRFMPMERVVFQSAVMQQELAV